MTRLLTSYELREGLRYCARNLSNDEHYDIVCVGGWAMILFYGYPEATSDIDALDLNGLYYRFNQTFMTLIEEFDETLPPDDKKEFWLNDHLLGILGVDHDDYVEHINYDIDPEEFYNDNGYCTITLRPITLTAIMKCKICAVGDKMRDKDIVHLTWILDMLQLDTLEECIEELVNEFPYIEDEWNWNIWEKRIYELYGEEYYI